MVYIRLPQCISAHACSKAGLASLVLALMLPAAAQPVQVGAGAYLLAPKNSTDKPVPRAVYRTDSLKKTAAQSNQWYSSVIYNENPDALFAHPLTIKPSKKGLELALPQKEIVPTERKDVEVHYAHKNPILIAPTAFAIASSKLAKVGDWSVDIAMQGADAQAQSMTVTSAHASPYATVLFSTGDAKVSAPGAKRLTLDAHPNVLKIEHAGRTYLLIAAKGTTWREASGAWQADFPANARYLSATALPDDKSTTEALLIQHAFAQLDETKVDWKVDPSTRKVTTTFSAKVRNLDGGSQSALLGLYPHQWHDNQALPAFATQYESIRGPIKIIAANRFTTEYTYRGFVPYWPAIADEGAKKELSEFVQKDVGNARRMMLEIGQGAYWQGKGLQRITKLMDVAEQQGDIESRNKLLALLKGRVEQWFSGQDRKSYFHYDADQGTVVAYPEEYFAVEQMNDHHFHYGYWIRAMADIALRDPVWASKAQWGGMVEKLISDIAHTKRGDSAYPFLRNFDMYEGHSWASGIGLGEWGNNQESSSEALNAWAGLIQWGEITNNTALRDLGIYMYSTEIEAVNHYWFDIHGLVFPKEYQNIETSMLFGGKYAHNTWWTDEPRQIKGINLLPLTTASTNLARSKDYILKNMGTLDSEMQLFASRGKSAKPKDIWQDLFAKYTALADPAKALKEWDAYGAVEFGDSRSHTFHWMHALKEMGTPDLSTTANTTFYSVFKDQSGRKTYLAYNAGAAPLQVSFSDGKVLEVAAKSLARGN